YNATAAEFLACCHVAAGSPGCWQIAVAYVVDHHAIGTESGRQGGDRLDHHRNPLLGQSVDVAIIKARNDLFDKHTEEIIGIALVGNIVVHMLGTVANGKAIASVVSLGPPAIENRTVQPAVEH